MRDSSVVGTEHVVVGIDGHEASDRAVDWVAVRRLTPGSRVELITVTNGWGGDRLALDRRLARAAERLTVAHQRVDVAVFRLSGVPDRMLADAASTADLLVIGNRRQHRVRTALDGWMPERVPTLANGPTVVVPEDWRPTHGDVVLGVDDATGDTALRFAGVPGRPGAPAAQFGALVEGRRTRPGRNAERLRGPRTRRNARTGGPDRRRTAPPHPVPRTATPTCRRGRRHGRRPWQVRRGRVDCRPRTTPHVDA